MGDSWYTWNILINKINDENDKCIFYFTRWGERTHELFDQPKDSLRGNISNPNDLGPTFRDWYVIGWVELMHLYFWKDLPDDSNALSVWFFNLITYWQQQQQHHLWASKTSFSSTPDLWNQNLWCWSPAVCVLTTSPDDFDAPCSLRTTT